MSGSVPSDAGLEYGGSLCGFRLFCCCGCCGCCGFCCGCRLGFCGCCSLRSDSALMSGSAPSDAHGL
jgi:hypothetical protein